MRQILLNSGGAIVARVPRPIVERGAVLVPRGAWHTANVHSPSVMLHVTMGSGTQHRERKQ